MSSRLLYDRIWDNASKAIEDEQVKIDEILGKNLPDKRKGISLLIPIRNINDNYNAFINNIKKIEPYQYYYPTNDLHITIFDFISGSVNYIENTEKEKVFKKIAEDAFSTIKFRSIRFEGITFSNEAGVIQGYDNDILIQMREEIRKRMAEYGIPNNERYLSHSSHITFCRFISGLKSGVRLKEFIEDNREYMFGKEEIRQIELVEHDWYNKTARKKIIGRVF